MELNQFCHKYKHNMITNVINLLVCHHMKTKSNSNQILLYKLKIVLTEKERCIILRLIEIRVEFNNMAYHYIHIVFVQYVFPVQSFSCEY